MGHRDLAVSRKSIATLTDYKREWQSRYAFKVGLHTFSVISTALFLLPSIINMFVGALNKVGIDMGVTTATIFTALGLGVIFALILEINTVKSVKNAYEEFIADRFSQEFILSAFVAMSMVAINVWTMVGGLQNSYLFVVENKALKIELRENKADLIAINKQIDTLRNKIVAINSGVYTPSRDELEVSKKANVSILKDTFTELFKKLQEKQKAYKAWSEKEMAKSVNFKNGKPTVFFRMKIAEMKQDINELKERLLKLDRDIKAKQSIKTEMTINKYLAFLSKKVEGLRVEKTALLQKIDKVSKKISLDKEKAINKVGFVGFLMFALFITFLQAGAEKQTSDFKLRYMTKLDNVRRLSKKKQYREEKKLDIFLSVDDKKEEINENRIEVKEKNGSEIINFMVSFYVKEGRLPSIKETAEELSLGKTKVKEARKVLSGIYFVTDKVSREIRPTELFLSLVEKEVQKMEKSSDQ